MALNLATLTADLVKLLDSTSPTFVGYPSDKASAAVNWCNTYHLYAQAATDISLDPVVTANLPGMINILTAQLPDAAGGTIVDAANAFDAAFVAYWTGAVFAIGTPIPPAPPPLCPNLFVPPGNGIWALEVTSLVTAVTPGVLAANLQPIFAAFTADPVSKASDIASAFHDATTTLVFVTIVGTDTMVVPGPQPISNMCTII